MINRVLTYNVEGLKQVLDLGGEVKSLSIQETHDMTGFLRANYNKIKMWTVSDGKETFVVLKWPHAIPELKVLP